MNESTALHTAARRYCQERFSYWTRIYEELQRKENWQVQRLFEPAGTIRMKRVIGNWESKRLWTHLKEVWGIDGSYWFPLKEGPVPQNVVAFHTDYIEAMNGVALLREALQSRSITRVFQLHEFGDPDYEIRIPRIVNHSLWGLADPLFSSRMARLLRAYL